MSADLLARIHELFIYDRENGRLIFKVDRGNRQAGHVAGSSDVDGYVRVRIDGRDYKLYHLIWLLETGDWVVNLDHRDGCPSNNRFTNLRPSTPQQNIANSRLPSHNSTGHRGVSWVPSRGKYRVRIKVMGKIICLGNYLALEDAVRAYESAALHHFGEFAYHRRPT